MNTLHPWTLQPAPPFLRDRLPGGARYTPTARTSSKLVSAQEVSGLPDNSTAPTISHDGQRSRVPLPPALEAGARLLLAWFHDRHGLRRNRPPWRFLSRTARFLALGRRQALVEAQMGSLSVLVSTSDRTIARSVFTSGDWDPLLVGTVFDALDEFGVRYQGTTFLEIGANFGVYSLPAVADLGFGRAIAYEPDPASFELLVENIRRNGLADRVAAHHAALSAAAGELTLSLGGSNAGDNRIVDETGAAPRRPTVRVPARTFDAEVDAGRVPLDDIGLVWLDVQGHERDVLSGAQSLLASNVPIVLEYSTAMADDARVRDLERIIGSHFDVLVDLGWCSLTGRLRFQPASSISRLAAAGRAVETDLLLIHQRLR